MKKIFTNKMLLMMLVLLSGIGLVACSPSLEPKDPNNEITITFITGVEGLEIPPIKGRPNTNIPAQEDPVREGYKFTGWKKENGESYRLTRFPKESMTLIATWELKEQPTGYTISFVTNSEDDFTPITVLAGSELPTLPIPMYYEANGVVFVFTEWHYEGKKLKLTTMPEKNIVLVAQWKSGTNVIRFEADHAVNPIVAEPGESISAPNVSPQKEGYTFKGWTYQGKPYIFDKMPNQSIIVKADYLKQSVDVYNATTSLPKLFINLENNQTLTSVTKETYVNSSITLGNVSDKFELNAASAEFKGRGNGSWNDSGPKRGYRIKFFEKQSVFGEEKSKHWVLLAGANFYDPTLLKTRTAFNMAKEVFTNIEYASSTNWVEFYVNGEYRGVYVLAEHVRVDKGRVDIDSQFGVDDTGYLIEYDSYAANEGPEGLAYFRVPGFRYGFTVKSPDPEDYNTGKNPISEARFRQQISYIQQYTENALKPVVVNGAAGYTAFENLVDVNSFVDMYLLHELFKNTDTGWSSFYLYKKAGGKLYAGVPWDFDASAGKNRGNQSPNGIYVAGSIEQESNHTASELYIALMKIPAFKTLVINRFKEVSESIEIFINQFISDDLINTHKQALGQNFYFWSVNRSMDGIKSADGSESQYTTYSSISNAETGWDASVKGLRKWLLDRRTWLMNEWK